MKRRLGAIAIVLMALTALAAVLSYVFPPEKNGGNPSATSETPTSPAFPDSKQASSASPHPQSPDQSVPPTQDSTTNRLAKKTLPAAAPRRTIADVLEGVDLSKPGERERVVAEMRQLEEGRKSQAEKIAREKGWPIRVETPNGSVREIADLDESGNPVYFITHNANAAVSTAANIVQVSPYSLSGLNMILGQWDGGSSRSTHQEFGGRVSVKDGTAAIDHATHVGGTMIAAGITAAAKGMAPSARIDSYDWTSDKTEMTAAAAATATDTNRILISNHSYGYVAGWVYVNGGSPYRVYEWYGNGTTTNSAESDFGMYNTYAKDSDALAFSSPYYLMFRSAGNDRWDNPSDGQAVGLSANATSVVTYDRSIHPAGDNSYRGGYETISYDALAKNVITIGSVSDAVSGTNRSAAMANLSSFSSTGPTDDGRIKPDVVANGEDLYSTLSGSDTSYGSMTGTSMSGPNAAGSAALVAQQHLLSFNKAMRSSTLKGLLIHTADDRGNPGPDYQYGWGLINVRAAVDLIQDQKTNPAKLRLVEGTVDATNKTVTHRFLWDGTNPIRITLAWIDPAGTAVTTADSRTPRLVNNLDLKLIRPDGGTNLPYVMPFVGNWTQASMSSNAITGTNNVDNVEQVYLATPSGAGTYQAVVSYQGSLSNSLQAYSLLVSGSSDTAAPPPAMTVDTVNPPSGYARTFTFDVGGTLFATNATLRFARTGFSDVVATNLQYLNSSSLRGQATFPANGTGSWDVTVSNSPSQTGTLSNGFTLLASLAAENFEGTTSGWSSTYLTNTGYSSNGWTLTTNASRSASKAYFAPGPSSRSTTYLTSPSYPIPAGATNLQIRFWHSYNFQTSRDGGRLELSNDGGSTWFAMETTNTDEGFSSVPYNGTISSSTSDFNLKKAWTGSSSGFVETVVTINTPSKYAGRNLRIRWVLASNSSTSSAGWYIDDLVVLGSTPPVNTPPAITSTASSSALSFTNDGFINWGLLPGDSLTLSVRASDDGGEPALSYTWSSDAAPGPDAPFFSPNGSNLSKDTTVYFNKLGDYALTVFVRDAAGLETSSTVHVRVIPAASAVAVFPGSANLSFGTTQAFTAVLQDQFGTPMPQQPATWNWSVNGGGTVSPNGLFTATSVGGPYTLSAEAGGLFDAADVTVVKANQTIAFTTPAFAQSGDIRPLSATASSGLPVSLEVVPSSLATLNGSALTFLSAGSVTITARQAGNENYLAAPEVAVTVSVSNPTFSSLFATNNPTSDADGDGIPALAEYALGGSTNGNDQDLLPVPTPSGSGLSLVAVVRTNDTNLQIYPQASLNLSSSNWSASGFTTNIPPQTNVPVGFERREYQFNAGTNPRAFLKLTIEQQ